MERMGEGGWLSRRSDYFSFPLHPAELLETWTARPPGDETRKGSQNPPPYFTIKKENRGKKNENAQLLLKPPPLLFRDLTRRALCAPPHHVRLYPLRGSFNYTHFLRQDPRPRSPLCKLNLICLAC
ncbi:hypothetical protein DFH06DRAFT_1125531 [Mycena polygramma]|nr:hypothetical protein DFH06DRAFT_1125531 [Mycena polygramma]